LGDGPKPPTPNPQSPIPNPQIKCNIEYLLYIIYNYLKINKKNKKC